MIVVCYLSVVCQLIVCLLLCTYECKNILWTSTGHPSRFLRQVVSTSLPDNGNVSDAADASDGST